MSWSNRLCWLWWVFDFIEVLNTSGQNISTLFHNLNLTTSFILKGGESVLLSAGIHSFPFKLGLPLGLPSTFLGKHGWVQYFCKAALREETGLTHKNQQVFIIMNPIDLNLEPPILAVRKKVLEQKLQFY
jgi:hypothetical protein